MMSMRRLLLCLSLCFAIPVQGMASVVAFSTPCPMQQPAPEAMAEDAELPPCCNDAETFAKTGNMCKTGQQCQAGSQYPSSVLAMPLPTAPQAVWFARLALLDPAFDLSSIWRPPASV